MGKNGGGECCLLYTSNRENACSVGYVRTICDVDTKEDVAELRNRLREKKSWQCSETDVYKRQDMLFLWEL